MASFAVVRRSQAVHKRAGLASYEPEHDPEGLTVEAAIELAACITRSPWPGSVLRGVEAVARIEDRAQHVPFPPVASGQGLDQVVVRGALLFEADPILEYREVLAEQLDRAHRGAMLTSGLRVRVRGEPARVAASAKTASPQNQPMTGP